MPHTPRPGPARPRPRKARAPLAPKPLVMAPLVIALIAGGLTPLGAAQGQTMADTQAGDVRLAAGMLLPPVNTTALRNERRVFDTPATVDVIPARDLDERMARNAEDVFRYTPGVFVNRQTSGTDPFRSLGGITVRGVGGNRVLTLVDGFRTLERITDNTRDVVDPWNLRRVEILRGPGSVLYGSDALGGVVNYITRNPNDLIRPGQSWGGEIGTSWSSLDNSLVTRGTYAVRAGDVSAMLSYQRRDANEPQRTRSRSPDGIWNCIRNPQATPCRCAASRRGCACSCRTLISASACSAPSTPTSSRASSASPARSTLPTGTSAR